MGKKLSGLKSKKIINYYLQGDSQTEIAAKLNIDQSTVSKYINKFKIFQEQKGTEAALLEFESDVPLEENQTIISEFKKSNLDPSDIQIALQLENVLQNCGITHQDYPDFIQTIKKTKDKKDYVSSAQILNQLENTTGLSYQDIINKANQTQKQLGVLQKELGSINTEINLNKAKLKEIEQNKQQSALDLKKHMEKIGVDEKRLHVIETLAMAMKKAKVSKEEAEDYINRQELLTQAGLGINILTGILEKAAVTIKNDNGKELIKLLIEYGSLAGVISQQNVKKQVLELEIGELEKQKKLKESLDEEVKHLKDNRKNIISDIDKMQKQTGDLTQLVNTHNTLLSVNQELKEEKTRLEEEIKQKETSRDDLDVKIEDLKVKLSNVSEAESKYDKLQKENIEIEAKINHDKFRFKIFESFLAFVNSNPSSLEELEKLVPLLPELIDEVKKENSPPDLIRGYVLEKIAGPGLQTLKCTNCQARFAVDKPKSGSGYRCPACYSTLVTIDEDSTKILNDLLKPRAIKKAIQF